MKNPYPNEDVISFVMFCCKFNYKILWSLVYYYCGEDLRDANFGYGTDMVLPCFVVVSEFVYLSTIIKSQILIKLFVKFKCHIFKAKNTM